MSEDVSKLLRGIPSISDFLDSGPIRGLVGEFGEGATKLELRSLLKEKRAEIRQGRSGEPPAPASVASELRRRLVRLARPEGRAAINASGILLHTGLGRAPLCEEAIRALSGCGRYTLLQTSIETGRRCRRDGKIERLLVELTGCEAATVVNNNAAATMIVLNTLGGDGADGGREVVLSRSQLVEIGGSFRMPEVMAKSGCVLKEVGTTNRTHLSDYEEAISEATAAIMHVHTSNYRMHGFVGWPDIRELTELGRRCGLPVIDDLGSGALVPLSEFGLADEPLVKDSISAGVEVACFSADKLICGPQSGVICGKRRTIERIRKNPFARMFRVSKLELAALEATLVHFVNGDCREALPLYKMLSRTVEDLGRQAEKLARGIEGLRGISVSVEDSLSYVGSGSAPEEGIPTKVLALASSTCSSDDLAKGLRTGVPSVFARISEEKVLLDMRTVDEDEIEALCSAVRRAAAGP